MSEKSLEEIRAKYAKAPKVGDREVAGDKSVLASPEVVRSEGPSDQGGNVLQIGNTNAPEQNAFNTDVAGGYKEDQGPLAKLQDLLGLAAENGSRENPDGSIIYGSPLMSPPKWVEGKMVTVSGKPLDDVTVMTDNQFQIKYAKELATAEANAREKHREADYLFNDLVRSYTNVAQKIGLAKSDADVRKAEEERLLKEVEEQETKRRQYQEKEGRTDSFGAAPAGLTDSDIEAGVDLHPLTRGTQQMSMFQQAQLRQQQEGNGVDDAPIVPLTMAAASSQPKEGGVSEKLTASWSKIKDAIEGDKPLMDVFDQYRSQRISYSLDGWLDGSGSLVANSVMFGAMGGATISGGRIMKVATVDSQFMRATGMGKLPMILTTMMAGAFNWGMTLGLVSIAFILGDRATTRVKKIMYPDQALAQQRSTGNYMVGFSCAMATGGIGPYYLLGDAAYAARLSFTGAVIGCALGWTVGHLISSSSAQSLKRLKYTTGELRTYVATMEREQMRYQMARTAQ